MPRGTSSPTYLDVHISATAHAPPQTVAASMQASNRAFRVSTFGLMRRNQKPILPIPRSLFLCVRMLLRYSFLTHSLALLRAESMGGTIQLHQPPRSCHPSTGSPKHAQHTTSCVHIVKELSEREKERVGRGGEGKFSHGIHPDCSNRPESIGPQKTRRRRRRRRSHQSTSNSRTSPAPGASSITMFSSPLGLGIKTRPHIF